MGQRLPIVARIRRLVVFILIAIGLGQCEWPKTEYAHWQKLHEAANEARERVRKAYMQMDEIDRNTDLSREGKERQRSKSAAQAIADFEASKTLAQAREAVELVVAKHNGEQHVSPKNSRI
jgi:hypothetical protein